MPFRFTQKYIPIVGKSFYTNRYSYCYSYWTWLLKYVLCFKYDLTPKMWTNKTECYYFWHCSGRLSVNVNASTWFVGLSILSSSCYRSDLFATDTLLALKLITVIYFRSRFWNNVGLCSMVFSIRLGVKSVDGLNENVENIEMNSNMEPYIKSEHKDYIPLP